MEPGLEVHWRASSLSLDSSRAWCHLVICSEKIVLSSHSMMICRAQSEVTLECRDENEKISAVSADNMGD